MATTEERAEVVSSLAAFAPPERAARGPKGNQLLAQTPSRENVEEDLDSTGPSEDDADVLSRAKDDVDEDAWFEENIKDVKVATIGNVDSGKSTLVGVLTKNTLDDGRGRARALVFNFSHEAANGRTSSVAQEIMGFRDDGAQVLVDRHAGNSGQSAAQRNSAWQKIVEESEKLVTFIDLCGHEKYLKTTIFGLVGLCPDYAMIIVNANSGFQKMSREHLGIALALHIPFMFVVTKIDMAPDNVFQENMAMLKKIVKSSAVKRTPLVVQSEEDLRPAQEGLTADEVCPIFCISNVTGEGLPLLKSMLSRLPSRLQCSGLFRPPTAPVEFHLDSVYNVTGVGIVAGGLVRSGRIRQNQQLLLGPDKSGQFIPVMVRTIHHMRTPVEFVESGMHCALALKTLQKKGALKKTSFRKGMVMLDTSQHPTGTWEFKAEVVILHHATTIREGYQAMLHIGIIRQAATVKKMSSELLRTGDKAIVTFRFMYHAEFLQSGALLLFREGRTKGLGRVAEIADESRLNF